MAQSTYSYEVKRYSNGEVSWCVFRHDGADTFIPGGAMGFGHSWALDCGAINSRLSRVHPSAAVEFAALDAECQAFDAIMRRCAKAEA